MGISHPSISTHSAVFSSWSIEFPPRLPAEQKIGHWMQPFQPSADESSEHLQSIRDHGELWNLCTCLRYPENSALLRPRHHRHPVREVYHPYAVTYMEQMLLRMQLETQCSREFHALFRYGWSPKDLA